MNEKALEEMLEDELRRGATSWSRTEGPDGTVVYHCDLKGLHAGRYANILYPDGDETHDKPDVRVQLDGSAEARTVMVSLRVFPPDRYFIADSDPKVFEDCRELLRAGSRLRGATLAAMPAGLRVEREVDLAAFDPSKLDAEVRDLVDQVAALVSETTKSWVFSRWVESWGR